jgi:mRNA interferase YafQ
MLIPIYQKKFLKDIEKAKKRGLNMEKIKTIVDMIINEHVLPIKNRNHKLQGDYIDCWECHIEPDWLLIYKKTHTEVMFVRTGSHSDLFA